MLINKKRTKISVVSNSKYKERELIKISLICSLLALDNWSSFLHFSEESHKEQNFANQIFEIQSTNSLLKDLSPTYDNLVSQELIIQLLQILNTTVQIKQDKVKSSGNDVLKQYLRKFSFLYRYYYINIYPNHQRRLSAKKTNLLAIKSLFLIQSL